jgi:nucleoside triphosphate pyrophosphatase
MPLWLAARPLVLASGSAARRTLLEAAGIPIEIKPASIDERAVETRATLDDPAAVAALLAREKAKAVAAPDPVRMVLGADQTLALGTRRFSKAADRSAAREQLRVLRGQTHTLHSGVAVVQGGTVLYEHVEAAQMTMRGFSDVFLESYLDAIGAAATASVGAYQLEGLGIQLFERVEGDHSTVLGLPLLPLLQWMRRAGLLAP